MPDADHIVPGVDGTPIPITHASANVAFQTAINGLPASGGDLYVLPGTQPYLFQESVKLNSTVGNRDNVTIHFSSGAILDFHPTPSTHPTELFLIQKRNFRCIGARVEHTAVGQSVVSGRSCFHVMDEDDAARTSDDAAFEDCRFRIQQGAADVLGFTCIRATGETASNPRRGLIVARTAFVMKQGTRQSNAWSGFDPFGICAIRGFRSASAIVTSSRFVGEPGGSHDFGNCGPMIYLDDSGENALSSNIFRKLDLLTSTAPDPIDPPVLIRMRGQEQEGHHTLVSANNVEDVNAYWILELDDISYDVVVANRFGRYGSICQAIIRTGSRKLPMFNPGGDTLVLAGNAFRDVPGGLAVMVQLSNVNNVTIAGSTFSDLNPGKQPIIVDSATCANVHLAPDQARSYLP